MPAGSVRRSPPEYFTETTLMSIIDKEGASMLKGILEE